MIHTDTATKVFIIDGFRSLQRYLHLSPCGLSRFLLSLRSTGAFYIKLPSKPKSRRIHDMEKAEIQQISNFLYDVYEGICEGDEPVTMQLQLTELYRVIRRLMDATFETKDQRLKVLLASLEYKARICKQRIEAILAVRN